jgi:hypothetical protein
VAQLPEGRRMPEKGKCKMMRKMNLSEKVYLLENGYYNMSMLRHGHGILV